MKKVMVLLFLLLLLIPNSNVYAKTLKDLKNELASLERKYEEANNKKNLADSEIKSLTAEVSSIASNIESLRNDIKAAEDEIVKSEEEIEEKKDETNELLKFLQVSSGENVYLEYVFEADSYTDFIYRYSIVSQLTEYNNNLMDELKALVKELNEKKVVYTEKKSSLEKKSDELNSKIAILQVNLAGYKEEGTTIEQDISDMKKEIQGYVNIGCKDNEDIATCGSGGLVNASGWTYPLVWGCVTSEYTGYGERTDWSGGGSHHGIDLDCVNEGTTVYAAAPGRVARVVYRSSCGGNMVFVYHIVNGREYTSVYMHLLSIAVSEGQNVTPSSVIGYVGGGSTASYDSCTAGAHLHFGLAYGHNAYSFNSNSFNPRNLFSFPKLVYNGGGYFSR